MLFPILYTCLLYGTTVHSLPHDPTPSCTPDPQPYYTEDFNGFNEPRDLCAADPGSYTYRLQYDNWLNVDATALYPSAPIVAQTAPEPYKDILFAATPMTTKSKTPEIAAYRDNEDQETFDLISLAFQLRSFCFNNADQSKCNQAAVPMAGDFTVTCAPADGGANVVQTFSYSTNHAKQNVLKTIDFTGTPGKDFKNLASCQFAATTAESTLLGTLTRVLLAVFLKLPLLGTLSLTLTVQNFIAGSTSGTTFLIDNITTAVTKCHIG